MPASATPGRARVRHRLSGAGRGAALALALLALAACERNGDQLVIQIPTFSAKPESQEPAPVATTSLTDLPRAQAALPGPSVPSGASRTRVAGGASPALTGGAATLSFEQMPLPAFIDAVFTEILKLDVQMDPTVAQRQDLVTLRTAGPRPADELFVLAQEVLRNYGVRLVYQQGVLQALPDSEFMSEVPQVIRGRTTADTPGALRPIFQFVPLNQVGMTEMITWLTAIFNQNITVTGSPMSNAIMVMGSPENVAAAVESARLLDQPRLAGRQSLRIEPVYWSAQSFADKLSEVFVAEGYNAATTPAANAAVVILPVPQINAVLIFAGDQGILMHARQWASQLDQPARADPLRGAYTYAVQNTTAESLGPIIEKVISGGVGGAQGSTPSPASQAPQPVPGSDPSTVVSSDAGLSSPIPDTPDQPRVVVDSERNVLIFIGSAEAYSRVRPLIEALDKPAREALIEVTVAEVTLDDTTRLGVEFSGNINLGGGNFGRIGTRGGLGLGNTGFTFQLVNGSDVRATVNALDRDNKVSILSTPRLVARSGGEAKISVGQEVPIITSSSQNTASDNTILQQVEYRNTGVILTIKPVVHSRDRVDLEISQEVSAAQANDTSDISSPLIQNRSVSTRLSLRDGATVLLGGLIQENRSSLRTGVPVLQDIPGLGAFFRNDSVGKERTELLVFITPYVINSPDDAAAITTNFRNRLRMMPQPPSGLRFDGEGIFSDRPRLDDFQVHMNPQADPVPVPVPVPAPATPRPAPTTDGADPPLPLRPTPPLP
ncbi:secretin N-terminal domain-containing protein [Zavarzinia sp. CC-PAN008]|uniref:secretin N-terminal domain-containing protein n=1 Tax=Zavarzinia sp. CC-PAN008 TaxID=3243332 RepID=UPI003F748BCD